MRVQIGVPSRAHTQTRMVGPLDVDTNGSSHLSGRGSSSQRVIMRVHCMVENATGDSDRKSRPCHATRSVGFMFDQKRDITVLEELAVNWS